MNKPKKGCSRRHFLKMTGAAGAGSVFSLMKGAAWASEKPVSKERRLELMILGTRSGCQRQGLGRTMMHHIFKFAQDQEYQSVVLEVAKETPAYGFYLSEGFLVEKEIALPAMPLCILRRPLAEPVAGGNTADPSSPR